jgi:hypothetical protein
VPPSVLALRLLDHELQADLLLEKANTFMPRLGQGASYMDPVFGATFLRVTSDSSVDHLYVRKCR